MLEVLELEWVIVEIILNAFQTCILRQTNNKMSTSQYLWPTLTPHLYNFYQTKSKDYFVNLRVSRGDFVLHMAYYSPTKLSFDSCLPLVAGLAHPTENLIAAAHITLLFSRLIYNSSVCHDRHLNTVLAQNYPTSFR
ncbi:hypothetical protein IAS59_006523 [Cryptococcus gattii]